MDANGVTCDADSPWAVKRCARGALIATGCGMQLVEEAMELLRPLTPRRYEFDPISEPIGIVEFNDNRAQEVAEIVDLFRRGAAQAEKAEREKFTGRVIQTVAGELTAYGVSPESALSS